MSNAKRCLDVAVCVMIVALPLAASAQSTKCPRARQDTTAAGTGARVAAPCNEPGERMPLSQRDASESPSTSPSATPATPKLALPPDPNREARALRERMHRALRRHYRGTLDAALKPPECRGIVEQMATQQPLLQSLRSEVRTQARERVSQLTDGFRDNGC